MPVKRYLGRTNSLPLAYELGTDSRSENTKREEGVEILIISRCPPSVVKTMQWKSNATNDRSSDALCTINIKGLWQENTSWPCAWATEQGLKLSPSVRFSLAGYLQSLPSPVATSVSRTKIRACSVHLSIIAGRLTRTRAPNTFNLIYNHDKQEHYKRSFSLHAFAYLR